MIVSGLGNSLNAMVQLPAVTRGGASVQSSVQPGEGMPTGQSAEQQRIQQQVQQLKAQEEKIKAHEAAHKAAGGQYASSATYSYRPGPDGRSYIVSGEVQIDMSPGQTPRETIAKMQIVQRAALAPADPSGQDRAVAAQAAAIAAQAQQEQLQQANAEQSPVGASQSAPPTGNTPSTMANGMNGQTTAAKEEGRWQATAATARQEDTAVAIGRSVPSSTPVTMYQANTTPGDIFAPQKVSTYA